MKLTPENKKEIIELYTSGIQTKTIAEKFNIRNSVVSRIMRRNNLPRTQGAVKITQDQIDIILQEYQNGISSEKIAKQLNINGSTVCRILKKNNISIRPATENKIKENIR